MGVVSDTIRRDEIDTGGRTWSMTFMHELPQLDEGILGQAKAAVTRAAKGKGGLHLPMLNADGKQEAFEFRQFADIAIVHRSNGRDRNTCIQGRSYSVDDASEQTRALAKFVMRLLQPVQAYADRGNTALGEFPGILPKEQTVRHHPDRYTEAFQVRGDVVPLGPQQWFATGNINLLDKQIRKLVANTDQFTERQFIRSGLGSSRRGAMSTGKVAGQGNFKPNDEWKPFECHR